MYTQSTTISALTRTLNAMFERAKQAQIGGYQLSALTGLYMVMKMVNGKIDASWLGDVPAVRRWKGSKLYGDLSEFTYSLEAKDFYDGFSIHKKSLRHDDLGSLQPRIDQLAVNLSMYEAELVLDALINGTTGLAYDGQAFFANRTVNDNLVAGTGTTVAQVTADLQANRILMMSFVTDRSRFTRYVPDTVVCPLAMEPTFRQILTSTDNPNSANRTANPYYGWIKNVIALPDLDADDVNDWYLLAAGYPLKPFIFGFETLENGQKVLPVVDDSKLASDGVIGYSAEMSGEAGYGMYEMAMKVVN